MKYNLYKNESFNFKSKAIEMQVLNIEKTALHLWWKRKKYKNLFDEAY